MRGWRNRGPGAANDIVVEFPIGTPYILVERGAIRTMTALDAFKDDYQNEDEISEFMKAVKKDKEKVPEDKLVHPSGEPIGGYR